MEIELSPDFRKKYLKSDVRIRNKTSDCLIIFKKNPEDLQLNNHKLKDKWEGFVSIDITNDYRAIYQEIPEGAETVAYFITLGTHKQLYG